MAFGSLAIVGLVVNLVNPPPDWTGWSSVGPFLFGFTSVEAFGLVLFRTGRARIVGDERQVSVVNAFHTYRLAWNEIAEFTNPGYFGIEIVLRNGRKVIAAGIEKSNAARWARRRTRADDVVDELNNLLRERGALSGSGLPETLLATHDPLKGAAEPGSADQPRTPDPKQAGPMTDT